MKKYPDEWVAIFDQQVASGSPDSEKLLDDLQANGYSVGQVLEHLTTHDELLILKI